MRNKACTLPFLFILITLAVFWLAPHSSHHKNRNKTGSTLRSGKNVEPQPLPHASRRQHESKKKSFHADSSRNKTERRIQTARLLPPRDGSFLDPNTRVPESDTSAATLAERFTRAVAEAADGRNFAIDPGVIETAIGEGAARIVFEDSDGTSVAKLAALHAADLRDFPLLSTGAATLDAVALAALIEETNTKRIEFDRVHRPTLAGSLPLIGADTLHAREEDGDGFAIAILDTGIDNSHPIFAGRIIEEACFSVKDDCPNEDSSMLGEGAAAPCSLGGCGHGTLVAGIAAGDDPDGALTGVAPHASIIAVQIFSDVDGEPGAYSSDILAGMQHVLALADFYAIASVNLSFGGGEYTENCDSATAMYRAVRRLRDVGIATVAASGNEAWTHAVSNPACLSNVISVGSTNDDDRVSSFSNSFEKLSLLAPGRSIHSAAVGGGSAFNSGTSMAAPHVAGAIASLREAYPNATVAEIENALTLSGLPVVDDRNGFTFPRIRADEAHSLLGSAASESPETDPPAAEPEHGEEGAIAAARPKSGGGGGSCGLVGIEPFLILGLVRGMRRVRGLRACPRAHT